MGITIGLDLGIASVGWAVVNDEYEVLESCSNIFSAAEASKNVERRGFRQGRRLTRRRRTRISDYKKMYKKHGFSIPSVINNEVLQLRIKGMTEKLSEDEIYCVLLNNLKHRGISYLDDAESGNVSGEYAASIAYNEKQLKDKLPSEIQYERLQKYGTYRGNITVEIDGNPVTLRNVFTISSYRKEINQFIDKQAEFNSKITEDFKNDYLVIFNRKREYYVGPGNEKSRTDYGKYTTKIDVETGEYITEANIFDKLIGKCSVYPEFRRAAGASYTAQEFNILNDLNNLLVNNRKLEEDEKHKIIDVVKNSKTVNMRKIIEKIIGEKIETFTGARIDKNEKEIFHTFEAYNKMRKLLSEIDYDINELSREELDIVGEVLTLNTDRDSILSEFDRRGIVIPDNVKDVMVNLRKNNGQLFNKWQSFCLEIMLELIPELYSQPKNQMQLLNDMDVFETQSDKFKECKEIPADIITEEIYNPVVAKTIKITIRVLNELIKKYGYPDRIVIEMPRDKNSDEEKKRINKQQRENENELKNILANIKEEYDIEITDKDFREHNKLTLKLKLWNEQQGRCPYSGLPIRIDDLLNDPFKFEVDHIIPLSISYDDSRANKVLVYATENQKKGNQTPYMYLSKVNRDWDFDEYMNFVLYTYKGAVKAKKRANMLFAENITKVEVLKGFITRNINDTRYASRVVLNTLKAYFKSKGCDTKVKVIRGSFTSQMRNNLKLEKDRNESYAHHAVDAMLIAFSQMGYEAYHKLTEEYVDYEDNDGEVSDKNGFDKLLDNDKVYSEVMYQNKWAHIRKEIKKAQDNNKYWYQVDKKCNRALCNQTIYGTRNVDGKTVKIKKIDIRTDSGFDSFKKIVEKGNAGKFLMYQHDPKTFELIMEIYRDYADAKNPFVQYEKETGDVIRKYSKKNNGPRISELRYEDSEVNSCIDISHKYGYERGRKKVILESLNPYRMDVYYNTNDKKYYLIGIKMSDIKCEGDKYVIDEEKYSQILIHEKMISVGQTRKDLNNLGYEYKMSFYKNDIIEYEKNGEIFKERFWSRTKPQDRNYVEIKPYNAKDYKPQKQIGLSKTTSIRKISKDILGNEYYVKQEKFNMVVDKRS